MQPSLLVIYAKYYSLFLLMQPIAFIGGFIQGVSESWKLPIKCRRPQIYRNTIKISAPIVAVFDLLDPAKDAYRNFYREMHLDLKESEVPNTFYLSDTRDDAMMEVRLKKQTPNSVIEIATRVVGGSSVSPISEMLDCYCLQTLPNGQCSIVSTHYTQFQDDHSALGHLMVKLATGLSIKWFSIKLKIYAQSIANKS